ncbi:RraA family protein [Pseudomonas serbica]
MTQTFALSTEQRKQLAVLPTATLSAVLSKLGMTNCWIRRATSLASQNSRRVVGTAFTLRFVPIRPGLNLEVNTRTAIEKMPEGCIAVCDTGDVTHVGVVGDVLSSRMHYRGVQALITDGAIRDADGIRESELLVWSAGVAAPLPSDGLMLVGIQEIVRCGGVTICPNDVLVCDSDGAVAIPLDLLSVVIAQAEEMERFEQWVITQVKAGASLPGLYPPNEAATHQYRSWLSEQL